MEGVCHFTRTSISAFAFIVSLLAMSGLAPSAESAAQGSITGVVTHGGPLANALVQVKVKPGGLEIGGLDTMLIVVEAKGGSFQPQMAAVMVGQPLEFKNSDGVLHSIRGASKVNPEFHLKIDPEKKGARVRFAKPEPGFSVKCDVHPHESAYVAVMSHPYFAVTGRDGRFTIDNLPDGKYELEAWHERFGSRTVSAVVKRGTARVKIALKSN